MKQVGIISDYVGNISFDKKNPLDFLIEDNISTNPYHKYIVRKIISQLEVRDHIHFLGPALNIDYTEEIFRTNNT